MFKLEMISWWEAQDVCERHGGYLAEVKSGDQQNQLVRKYFIGILKIIKENLSKMLEDFVDPISWFIGLSDFGHEGRYQKYKL